MNKKDVLGARPAAWITGKMESIPHWHGLARNLAYVQKAGFALV